MQSIGFKEWALVCAALESGRQSILLRKGGMAEGKEGFAFKHEAFFLFPTWFHEQPGKVREMGPAEPEAAPGEIRIASLARVEFKRVVTSWPTAAALAPFHILRDEVVAERFAYEEKPSLHLAFVRVFLLASPWILPNEKRFGGCRSWVNLPEPPSETGLGPVLSDDEHEGRSRELRAILGEK